MKRSTATVSAALAALVLLVASAAHAVPTRMTYSGRLLKGEHAVKGTVQITFTIYDAETGGAVLWSEAHSAVTVTNGIFSLTLGKTAKLLPQIFNGETRWLQIALAIWRPGPRPRCPPWSKRCSTATPKLDREQPGPSERSAPAREERRPH